MKLRGPVMDDKFVLRLVIFALLIAVLILAGSLINQHAEDTKARQDCLARNRQHELQSAMSGGRYTYPEEDCH